MADMSMFQKYAMILIVAIVGFSLFAALYPEASSAGDGVSDEGMCENNNCFYNVSRTGGALGAYQCTANNETNIDNSTCTASGYQTGGLPLAGLFAGGGIMFIVIAAGILMLYLRKSR